MTKRILKKIYKNGQEYEVGNIKLYVITEDMVSVETDDTKGVDPYNTSYWYTNITIDASSWIEWKEWAFYYFEVNTTMVVASANRNVRVRIGTTWSWLPVKNRSNSILNWSSYFVKTRTDFFVYKTVYESNWALHLNTDTAYSSMSVAEWQTWTATSNRVMRADYLKQIIQYHSIIPSKAWNQTITNTKTGSWDTTPLSLTSKGSAWSCFIAMNGKDWFLASYGVDSNKKPQFYNGNSNQLAIISWAQFGSSWSWVSDKSPSQNAVYNKITSMDTTIADKLDNPSWWNVGDVLTKTANWEEWQAPSWWGGWSVDTETVNALIDIKLWSYDSVFSLSSWLYKILNDITDEDELGLTWGDTWSDIVSNSTSMSKISHGWTVMWMVANSSVAMNWVVWNDSATKEVSECWNSIILIADCELAKDIYIWVVLLVGSIFIHIKQLKTLFLRVL